MTDLLLVLPDFPTKTYTHLIPGLEKHAITLTDLLTIEPVEVAKRAQLPSNEVKRLSEHALAFLQKQLGLQLDSSIIPPEQDTNEPTDVSEKLRRTGKELVQEWSTISTLSPELDGALGGGIPTGYITEITGESGAGKTQFLLTLLLSAQLPAPHGLSRAAIYISTEHALPTTRLRQVLAANPILSGSSSPPSLSRILSIQIPDLESQDHILTYQLPVALRKHHVGLVVIDSIAANYRAEAATLDPSATATTPAVRTPAKNSAAALSARSADLIRTGALLRQLARQYDCAIVVANQVADRFFSSNKLSPLPSVSNLPQSNAPQPSPPPHLAPLRPQARNISLSQTWSSSPHPPSSPSPAGFPHDGPPLPPDQPAMHAFAVHPALSLDHQQRFFTGWGDGAGITDGGGEEHAKTPTLGLVWANQIACRIALVKEMVKGEGAAAATEREQNGWGAGSAEWTPKSWRRWARVVYSPWVAGVGVGEKGVEFEVWAGGLRGVKAQDKDKDKGTGADKK